MSQERKADFLFLSIENDSTLFDDSTLSFLSEAGSTEDLLLVKRLVLTFCDGIIMRHYVNTFPVYYIYYH